MYTFGTDRRARDEGPRPRLWLSPFWAGGVTALCWGFLLLNWSDESVGIGAGWLARYLATPVLIGAAGCALLSFGVFRAAGRCVAAGNFTFLAGALALTAWAMMNRRDHAIAAWNASLPPVETVVVQAAAPDAARVFGSSGPDLRTNVTDSLTSASGAAVGESAVALRCLAELNRALDAAARRAEEAAAAFPNGDPFDCRGMMLRKHLQERIAAIEKLAELERQVADLLGHGPAILESRLVSQGVSARTREATVTRYRMGGEFRLADAMRTASADRQTFGLAAMRGLEEAWGRWHFDPEIQDLAFESPQDERPFRRNMDQVKRATERLESLRRQAFGASVPPPVAHDDGNPMTRARRR